MNLFTRTFSKIFKSSNQQELDNIQNIILAINNKEKEIQSLSDGDIKEKTFNFQKNTQSGSLKLNKVPKKVIKIVDFKCPSSNMMDKNDWTILSDIDKNDEIKFVIGNKEDYDWSKKMINKYKLNKLCPILFSPVYNKMNIKNLSKWILKDGINVRLQSQLHKDIWGPEKTGV